MQETQREKVAETTHGFWPRKKEVTLLGERAKTAGASRGEPCAA